MKVKELMKIVKEFPEYDIYTPRNENAIIEFSKSISVRVEPDCKAIKIV